MKIYMIYALAKFNCEVEGKRYNPKRAMIGHYIDGVCVGIKLIKCSDEFNPPTNKLVNIFFDENGKAVSYKLAE